MINAEDLRRVIAPNDTRRYEDYRQVLVELPDGTLVRATEALTRTDSKFGPALVVRAR